jgi:hypothetical protein
MPLKVKIIKIICINYASYMLCRVRFMQMPVIAGLFFDWHLQGPVQAGLEVCWVWFTKKKLQVIIIIKIICMNYARYMLCRVWFMQMLVIASLFLNRHLQGPVQASLEVCQVWFMPRMGIVVTEDPVMVMIKPGKVFHGSLAAFYAFSWFASVPFLQR